MKTMKKIGFWICVAASVLVIGTSVSGYISDKNADKTTTEPEAQIVAVIE